MKEVVKKKQLKGWTKTQKGIMMGQQRRMEMAMLQEVAQLGFPAPGMSNHNDHPYKKLGTLKKITIIYSISFYFISIIKMYLSAKSYIFHLEYQFCSLG